MDFVGLLLLLASNVCVVVVCHH